MDRDRTAEHSSTAPESPERSRLSRRNVVQIAISLALVGIVFVFALPQFADFSKVWGEIREMTWLEILTLVTIAIWNLLTYWLVEVSALPGSNIWQSMKVTQTATAVANTVPGGGALGVAVTYGMYSAYGFSRAAITLSILASGLWNNLVKMSLPILALSLLALSGEVTSARLIAAAFGLGFLAASIALFAFTLRSERFARWFGNAAARLVSRLRRAIGRAPVQEWGEHFAGYRAGAIDLLRKRGLALTATTLVSHVSLYLVLLLCLRHIGVAENEVGWIEALAVFAFVRLLTALPVTPGGLGVVEVALSGGLIAAGGDEAQTVAAVLVYRALTYVLPIAMGLLGYMQWRRGAERRRERVERLAEARLAEKAAT